MSDYELENKRLQEEIDLLKEENFKLQESSLNKELARQKELLEFLPELIFEMSLDGKITYVNQSGLDIFGYTVEEFKESFSIRSFFPNDFHDITNSLTKLINEESFERKPYLAAKKNGDKIPVILSTTIVKKNDIPVMVRGLVVDITRQYELEDRFQNLFKSSPFPTVILNPESGEVLMLNSFAKELFGISSKNKGDKDNIFFFVHDQGKLTFRNYIQLITDQDTDESYTTLISTKSGEERNVKIFSTKIKISGKIYIQCVFQDITSQIKQDEKEIEQRKQKELLALSVFQLNNYKDKDSMFRYMAETLHAFNPKSIVLVGDYIPKTHRWKLNYIYGAKIEKFAEIINYDITKIEIDVIDYQLPENRLFVDIETLLNEDNFYKKLSKVKLKLLKKTLGVKNIFSTKLIVNKKIFGGMAIFTPNKNFLAENEFIEIFISQAGIILDRIFYENQLIEAKEKAIESDRLKSAFLSNMSHEIRTPMNSILGFSNLILNEDLTDELKTKYSSLIQNSGDILVKLIDDIIDISKIESNQLEILHEEFIVNEIIDELKMEYIYLKEEKSSKIEMNFINKDEPFKIKSDRSRIKQILNNLINNSTKFTSEGSINIWFEVIGARIVFHVKDSGIGIAKDKQDIIFDRFRQADESPTRPFRGAGLGLSISKHLANLLEGDILVNSQKNIGTEFIITLPTNQKIEQTIMKQYIKPLEVTETNWEKYTIYIAEDEDSNYFLLEAYLKNTNVKHIWFKNGVDLLAALEEKQPDLILLDLKMPEMDGYAAATEIKKKYPDLYIIAQTAYAMADEKNKAMKAGCDDFVTKPIKKEVLYYKIAKHLGQN